MIGVCIKYFHENYGGMLQAYATVSMLEARGLDYELICYEKKHTPFSALKSAPRLFNSVLLNDKKEQFLKNIGKVGHREFKVNSRIRAQSFDEFKKKNFTNLSPVFSGYKELCAGAKRYKAVITGSDQLWSPAGLPTNFYNLMFVPDDIRKISYASSFGVKRIPWYQKKRTAAFLNRIEFISMREKRGSEIVKELTDRDVQTVLDPVFMFNQEEWKKLIPEKKEIEEPYIFAYFLGKNSEHRSAVTRLSKETGLKIVTLRHLDQYISKDERFGTIAPYDVSPERFLNLLRGAQYVCTDSFHGTCFSIIHNKPFITFNRYEEGFRNSKNSRIDTLCGVLGLQARRYESEEKIVDQMNAEINYIEICKQIVKLKDEANEYLNRAFCGV